jgi:ATP-dependent DNA helicase RecQ
MTSPRQVLKRHFGYEGFRDQQETIIQTVLDGRSAFVLMPTGGGKSLCYQIPALLSERVTVVVSPLIALMKDQVDALRMNGISADYLNSALSGMEQAAVIERLRQGETRLLYVAPERLFGGSDFLVALLQQLGVALFAIDEAHCVSQWGHDFRPEYFQLSRLRGAFSNVPVLALTATADHLTRQDIVERLALEDARVFVSSFNRENIRYTVRPKQRSYEHLVEYLRQHPSDSGIVYALSRKSVDALAEHLQREGFAARPYHAGLSADIRERHQEQFQKDEVTIIVATIAFGMGINKSNVRFVVHMDLPKNIESYYQETGRAGRDGLPSEAVLFYSAGDVARLKRFVSVEGNPEQTAILLRKLSQMADFCEIRSCRRQYLLRYFGEEAPDACGNCDVCLTEYETFDGTVIAQKAISAVVRLQERFGASYAVDFLRGSKAAKIRPEHKLLKTYGVGADLSRVEWLRFIKDLVALGYLRFSEGEYPLLQLTAKSAAVLKGEVPVLLVRAETNEEVAQEATAYEATLLEQLKQTRKQAAHEANVPAFMVFSDATLVELATRLPLTLGDIRRISGFGEIKTERYGEVFLDVVVAYCAERGLESRMAARPQVYQQPSSVSGGEGDTKRESLKLFRAGKSIKTIARLRHLTVSTIENHLAYFIGTGEVAIRDVVAHEKIAAIRKVVDRENTTSLKSLKEQLGDEYSYGEIRAVLAERNR